MSFVPILPYGGSDGWGYLKQTLDSQRAKHDDALPTITKIDLETFRNQVSKATTAETLADDPLLRRIALDAFGLGKLKPSRAFLVETLSKPTTGPDAAKTFADPRWFELAKAFGYGDAKSNVAEAGFGDAITARYRLQRFEDSVGAASPDMRRALAFDRAMTSLAAAGFDEATGWAQALADPAIRPVLTQAFGLGAGFESAPPAEQIRQLRTAAEALTGSRRVDAFTDSDRRDAVLDRFFGGSRGSIAGIGFTRPNTGQGGVAGWRVLQASLDNQRAGFARSTANNPDLRHFTRSIASKDTAADFVKDDRLVSVALTAFGLSGARPTADFLKQVLESDVSDPTSFANRQADPRWREMAAAFGYGGGMGARVAEFGFADEIAARWQIHSFEEAVGRQDNDLRLGLILDRTLVTLAGAGLSARDGWDRALANPSIALALGRAFELGEDFTTLPRAEQIAKVQAAARALTGSDRVDAFASGVSRDVLVRRFLRNAPGDTPARGLGQPVIPLPGLAGWSFLKRTLASQQESFAASASVRREMDYFREKIGSISSAADLVADRRLLSVALEAFGMGPEIDKRAFVEKALREGSEDPKAMAVRLADPRWREMAAAFGFGDGRGPQTAVDGFADGILARYKIRAFETAVGTVDESMRLALNFDRTMQGYAAQGLSENAAWYRVLGDVPLRTVLESALGLPKEFAKVDIDQQVSVVRQRAARLFGNSSIKAFAEASNREDMIRRFLVRESMGDMGGATARGLTALTMLQSIPRSGLNRLA